MTWIPVSRRGRIAHATTRLAAAAIGACALAACGGGGGGTSLPLLPPSAPAPAPAPATPPAPPPAAAAPLACELASFATLKLDRASVDAVQAVPAGDFTPPGSRTALTGMPDFCRIQGTTNSVADSSVRFELWVPMVAGWNGKLVVTGNGGYSPSLNYGDMRNALLRGFATMGGDTGHSGEDMLFVIGHPQKIVDWGTSSVHDITVAGKTVLAALQAKAATRSYYYGCSTGGHQGYAEVQRYPGDFDGVIAGAPGGNRTSLNAEFLNRFLANHAPGDNTTPILTSAKIRLVTQKAVAACDAIDGVTDGVIADPRECTGARFDVASLLCTAGDGPDCLTAPQVAAVQRIYAGAVNPRTKATIYPGPAVGSESGWASYWGTTEPTRADFWRYWVFDNPGWDWWSFDFDRHMTYALAKVGPAVDQVNPDISAFKARGGKLIAYQGWSDPVVSPHDTIAYYEKVNTLQGSRAETDGFFRLFMAPGMGHCSGGTGATSFGNQGGPVPDPSARNDLLAALDDWVEKGKAPDVIVASRIAGGAVTQTRPLCPHPKRTVYKGTGSTDAAENFACQ